MLLIWIFAFPSFVALLILSLFIFAAIAGCFSSVNVLKWALGVGIGFAWYKFLFPGIANIYDVLKGTQFFNFLF